MCCGGVRLDHWCKMSLSFRLDLSDFTEIYFTEMYFANVQTSQMMSFSRSVRFRLLIENSDSRNLLSKSIVVAICA